MKHNARAWDEQVRCGNRWTIPVDEETIASARRGNWRIFLTPTRPVPVDWFPCLAGADVLCLASGGGQQGPVLAAAGAHVTVLDNSPGQLARDREVAERESLDIDIQEGDMADLSRFDDESFDLVVHPVSNCFVPNVRPVWCEAHRVLRSGAALISGFSNGVIYLFDEEAYDRGEFIVTHPLPYSDLLSSEQGRPFSTVPENRPLEFGHTLEDQIGGQIDAGFVLRGFYEDRSPEEPLAAYLPMFIATRSVKPGIREPQAEQA